MILTIKNWMHERKLIKDDSEEVKRIYLGIVSFSMTHKMFYRYELLVDAINHNNRMSTNPKI